MDQAFDSKLTFIGSKAENIKLIKELVDNAINCASNSRIKMNNEDDPIFDENYIESESYKNSKELIVEKTNQLLEFLKNSILYSSPRVQSFMIGDTTIGSIVGNVASLFYNGTNVTYLISNTMIPLEFIIVNDMCRMIGFEYKNPKNIYFEDMGEAQQRVIQEKETIEGSIQPFGHLTSGGSLANIEALWCSYWVKFIPLCIKDALQVEGDLKDAKDLLKIKEKYIYSNDFMECIEYKGDENNEIKLISLSNWDLLNLNSDEAVRLPFLVAKYCNLSVHQVYPIIKKYHPYSVGVFNYFTSHKINLPIYIIPESSHYSLGKAACLLGLGYETGVKEIVLDKNRRMNIDNVEKTLNECWINRTPVINITCICGSTQEGAVDHMDLILNLKEQYRNEKKLSFDIHVDGAFGAFFLTMIREDFKMLDLPTKKHNFIEITEEAKPMELYKSDLFESESILSNHMKKQLSLLKYADTVTIDCHKHGFINFTAGGIFFRNDKFKYILNVSPIYIGGNSIESTGIWGIEGSRNQQAVSAIYLTNSIMRPSKGGYGRLLKRSLLNSKLFYLGLLCFNELETTLFKVHTTTNDPSPSDLEYLRGRIFGSLENSDEIIFPNLNEINWDEGLLEKLSEIGPDTDIINYCFNPKNNTSYNNLHQLNKLIGNRFGNHNAPDIDLSLSSTMYGHSKGIDFINGLLTEMGIKESLPSSILETKIPFVRSVLMDPFVNETTNVSCFTNIFKLLKKEINSFILDNNLIN
ncbi:hypothetical protein DICPUDRAFT_75453 [Dictyostelium purpureum]|uniref:Uncharacterized protein n=1 Tax=Dictyostelium purpureum TaxID=5786 RepID=F0ZAP8_DICPU|nr:uncharacterized protein DICPUDRAFT_75453 [Dictyostelium purpureum]EGC38957.1 hypothetical protein DICPUDRAFT_75453 [Dictyostelium purpureum]|eukprot:XP_003284522.1 hypothetical protein DICPUDRAFT_75453 [Dictyostelium purpureum]